MKKSIIKFFVVTMVFFSLTGCGWSSVEPTEKGKVLSLSGYSGSIKQPGIHFMWFWQNMIKLDTSTVVADERIEDVVMSDRLMMNFTVQFRTRIDGSDQVLNAMFSDIRPVNDEISITKVYSTYGQRTVQKVARSVLSQYKVQEVLSNYEAVGSELHKKITDTLLKEGSPLVVSNVVLGKPEPPQSVMAIIQATEERREKEALEAAQQEIEVLKRKNAITLAELDREKKIIEAQALRDQNQIVDQGLSESLLKFRQLETMEKMSENGATVYFPYSDMGSVGLQNRIYNK